MAVSKHNRMTVADLRAAKSKRQLAMLFVAEIEVVPARVAAEICKRTSLFLMSMGAGSGCDAHYVFAEDVLGVSRGHKPRHAKVYRNFLAEYDRLKGERIAAFKEYQADVERGAFPEDKHLVPIAESEFAAFMKALAR